MRDYRLAIIINAYRQHLAAMLAPTAWGIRPLPLQAAILKQVCSGGIRSSFFLSAGELQAPCPKKNDFLYPARQRKAEGFSPHRTNNAGRFTALP